MDRLAESVISAVIVGIAERQIGDVPLQVFNNVQERIGQISAQTFNIGLVRADMTEIGNADRGHEAFLAQPYGSTALLLLPVETGNDQDAFGMCGRFADIQTDFSEQSTNKGLHLRE